MVDQTAILVKMRINPSDKISPVRHLSILFLLIFLKYCISKYIKILVKFFNGKKFKFRLLK